MTVDERPPPYHPSEATVVSGNIRIILAHGVLLELGRPTHARRDRQVSQPGLDHVRAYQRNWVRPVVDRVGAAVVFLVCLGADRLSHEPRCP